jgi:hypothetical protein
MALKVQLRMKIAVRKMTQNALEYLFVVGLSFCSIGFPPPPNRLNERCSLLLSIIACFAWSSPNDHLLAFDS